MAKLIDGGKRTQYDSYDEYIERQDSRFHDYDCPNCLANNNINIADLRKRGIKFSSLLDVGCRDAGYFDALMKEGVKCKGVDISPRSIEYTKSKGRDVVLGDVSNLSGMFKEKFDLIVSNHTLEQFLEPERAMKECFKVLSDNGHVMLKLPNEGPVVTDVTNYAHVRTFSEKELKDMLVACGFEFFHFELVKKANEFYVILKKNFKIVLNAVPSNEWQLSFNKVKQDPYIAKKYNRENRIKDKKEYVNEFLPEVKKGGQLVVDIGPGPGEFLEVCRSFKNSILGIDAAEGDSEMGNNYQLLSKLMTERQNVPVMYVGFENLIANEKTPFEDGSVGVINSQGAIEQVFKDYMDGPPLREHLNSNLLSWRIDSNLEGVFIKFYDEIARILVSGGVCLIYGNGANNTEDYNKMIKRIVGNNSKLDIVQEKYGRLHKVVKG